MKLLRKLLILSHRYLGIAISLLVMMWFATGIVMMYAGGMPRLTPERRLERMPALDLSRVQLTPSGAVERAELSFPPDRVSLATVMDRPAYRLAVGRTMTVFADNGEVLDEVSLEQARTIASRFMDLPEDRFAHVGTLTSTDQWTLAQGRQLPFYKFTIDDGEGTELYVSARTGEVTLATTRSGRVLAWIGTIPHWLYFNAIRLNQPLWFRIVVWTSTLACIVALIGLVLGITQWRRSKPFRLAASIPYAGWMRWHYITGVVFGFFTLTFAFSGLLSMEPYEWTNATGLDVDREVFTGGPAELERFGPMNASAWDQLLDGRQIKEVEFARIQDEPYYIVRHAPAVTAADARRERLHQPYGVTGRNEPDRLLVAASTMSIRSEPFSVDSLVTRLKAALPDVPIADYELLSEYDSYYYSRGRQTPLPVLRVRFEDPAETWVYIDPEMSQVLAQIHRLNRVERWLYNGFHSLDFAFWYDKRPLWDIGMIALCLGGLASSGIGLALGIKRMRRAASRTAKLLVPAGPPEVRQPTESNI
jgi:uncharacterized iron-regulated membrane protein